MKRKPLDRFDANAKRNVRISFKLIAFVILAIVTSAAAAAAISLGIFYKGMFRNTQSELEGSARGAENILSDWGTKLRGAASLISQSPDIADALENGGADALKALLDKKTEALDIDAIAVCDKNFFVVQAAGSGLLAGESLSSSAALKKAATGAADFSCEPVGQISYAELSASPIFNDGRLAGYAVACYDLTRPPLVRAIQGGFGVECTVFKGDERVSSTIAGVAGTRLENKEIVDTVLRKGGVYVGNNAINGEDYSSVYMPLKSSDGSNSGMLFCAKSVASIEALRNEALEIVIPIVAALGTALAFLSFLFIMTIMKRITSVAKFLGEIENGDLTRRLDLLSRDEVGDMVIHVDSFLDKMQNMISQIKESKDRLSGSGNLMNESAQDTAASITEILANIESMRGQIASQVSSVNQTASAVNQIASNIESLERMIESQSSSVTQASAAVEQMIGNISSVNQSVGKMAETFGGLQRNASSGIAKQQAVDEQIRQIETQSAMLQEANAAIEAAHAGEAGKGFAVVADEIRKLSETSSAQSKTIGGQLKNIQSSIEAVVAASVDSSGAFNSVSRQIEETDALVMQIKSAMEEQQEGSRQITEALHIMNGNTGEVRGAASEMDEGNKMILQEVSRLQEFTSAMQGSMEEMSVGAAKINETGAALGSISEEVKESIEKIGTQIDQFTV